jgi:hypothetical protein
MPFTQKHTAKNIVVAFVLSCFLISCTTKPESALSKYGPEVEAVMHTDAGAFRGFNLGDKIDTVLAKEVAPASEADEGYLYYEFKLDSTASFNVSYNFDELGLNEIQSEVYINNPDNTENVFNAFKLYFDEHFGKNVSHQGFTVWTVKSDKYGDVRINLSDDSAELTVPGSPGKITLWIYPDSE